MYMPDWQVINDPFVMLVVLLLVPASCWWLGRARFATRLNRGVAVLSVGLYALFAMFVYPWVMFTIHLRWLPLLAWLAASTITLRRLLAPAAQPNRRTRRRRFALIICAGAMLLIDANLLKGLLPPARHIELAFPFKHGAYTILQGGSSSWINFHFRGETESRFGLDIVQVDNLGRRADGLLPQLLDAYHTYRDEVYSPCSGRVMAVIDGWPDSPLSSYDADEPGGNQVAIECGGAVVWLQHLLNGSIEVAVGQTVQAGDALAQVGNSGKSSEPHLHIHAQAMEREGMGASLAITFSSRYLTRNMVYRVSVH